jgi:hypothetical protein
VIGNIAAIPAPVTQASSSFDIYPPEVSQVIKRSYQSVIGEKTFDYFVVPRKDGTFALGRYFQWIYFNSAKERYDTLRSSRTLEVKGEDYRLANLSLSGSAGLYDNLESLDSSNESINYKATLKRRNQCHCGHPVDHHDLGIQKVTFDGKYIRKNI